MRFVLILLFFCLLLGFSTQHFIAPVSATETSKRAIQWFGEELFALNNCLSASLHAGNNIAQQQSIYSEARLHYKRIEFFVEYFYPRPAKYFINGPLVSKYDEALGNQAIAPHGFQRIEELLFDGSATIDTALLFQEVRILQQHLVPMFSSGYYAKMGLSDGMLLEMCQVELYRISTLNINGYDATYTKTNVAETQACFEGLERVIQLFGTNISKADSVVAIHRELLQQIVLAKQFLGNHSHYDSFPRLMFITQHVLPIYASLVQFHLSAELPWTNRFQALKLQEQNCFSQASFNPTFFAPYNFDTTFRAEKVKLGKLLFFDPVLSGDGKRSCASCHNPDLGFSDGQNKSIAMGKNGKVTRNAPSLYNTGFQTLYFDDGRAFSLEQQVAEVIQNPIEMQSNLKALCTILQTSKEYRQLFAGAFKGTVDSTITPHAIQRAIAEYERTLLVFNSRFDQYLAGNTKALTVQEQNGYTLFAGKALCGSCHFLPLFSGITPPFFDDTEFEVIGTPASVENKALDTDSGRYKVTKRPLHLYAFKTPTVRNVSFSAPYMHNGVYATLEEVVDFYHKGGGVGLGFEVPYQTLPFDSLSLTSDEKGDIVLFLKSLADTTSAFNPKPKHLPLFERGNILNKRKIGGEY